MHIYGLIELRRAQLYAKELHNLNSAEVGELNDMNRAAGICRTLLERGQNKGRDFMVSPARQKQEGGLHAVVLRMLIEGPLRLNDVSDGLAGPDFERLRQQMEQIPEPDKSPVKSPKAKVLVLATLVERAGPAGIDTPRIIAGLDRLGVQIKNLQKTVRAMVDRKQLWVRDGCYSIRRGVQWRAD